MQAAWEAAFSRICRVLIPQQATQATVKTFAEEYHYGTSAGAPHTVALYAKLTTTNSNKQHPKRHHDTYRRAEEEICVQPQGWHVHSVFWCTQYNDWADRLHICIRRRVHRGENCRRRGDDHYRDPISRVRHRELVYLEEALRVLPTGVHRKGAHPQSPQSRPSAKSNYSGGGLRGSASASHQRTVVAARRDGGRHSTLGRDLPSRLHSDAAKVGSTKHISNACRHS